MIDGGSTAVLTEWQAFVANQVRLRGHEFTGPKLVCIDVQPYAMTQAPERTDILNIGGFSDAVFAVVSAFFRDDAARFVAEAEAIELSMRRPTAHADAPLAFFAPARAASTEPI